MKIRKSPQWVLNARGALVEINPSWRRTDVIDSPAPVARDPSVAPPSIATPAEARTESPPPRPEMGTESPPPLSLDQEPLAGGKCKNQEPPPGAPTGVCISHEGEAKSLPAPTMRDVKLEDLRDTPRLLTLYAEAIRLGIVADSECDRLRFVAAAEHARVVGSSNPYGLFVSIVRRGLWRFLTQADEDTARERLRRHDRPPPAAASPLVATLGPTTRAGPPPLSDDARAIQSIKDAFAKIKMRNAPAPRGYLIRQGWTPERYDQAEAELENHRSARQRSTAVQRLGVP
jgi:hypothetical protein